MKIVMSRVGDEPDLECPHCGTEYHDADQEAEAGEAIAIMRVDCGSCGQPFDAQRWVKFTYSGVRPVGVKEALK